MFNKKIFVSPKKSCSVHILPPNTPATILSLHRILKCIFNYIFQLVEKSLLLPLNK